MAARSPGATGHGKGEPLPGDNSAADAVVDIAAVDMSERRRGQLLDAPDVLVLPDEEPLLALVPFELGLLLALVLDVLVLDALDDEDEDPDERESVR